MKRSCFAWNIQAESALDKKQGDQKFSQKKKEKNYKKLEKGTLTWYCLLYSQSHKLMDHVIE